MYFNSKYMTSEMPPSSTELYVRMQAAGQRFDRAMKGDGDLHVASILYKVASNRFQEAVINEMSKINNGIKS